MNVRINMNLRDQFAIAALTGFTSSLPPGTPYDLDTIAKQSYELADALMNARDKTKTQGPNLGAELAATAYKLKYPAAQIVAYENGNPIFRNQWGSYTHVKAPNACQPVYGQCKKESEDIVLIEPAANLQLDNYCLTLTCAACPEQYDVYDGKIKVGYLRLRHGVFRADCPDCGDTTVYTSYTKGDGVFEPEERVPELRKAVAAIKKYLSEKT